MSAGERDPETTRDAVSRLLGEGLTQAAIASELRVSQTDTFGVRNRKVA